MYLATGGVVSNGILSFGRLYDTSCVKTDSALELKMGHLVLQLVTCFHAGCFLCTFTWENHSLMVSKLSTISWKYELNFILLMQASLDPSLPFQRNGVIALLVDSFYLLRRYICCTMHLGHVWTYSSPSVVLAARDVGIQVEFKFDLPNWVGMLFYCEFFHFSCHTVFFLKFPATSTMHIVTLFENLNIY